MAEEKQLKKRERERINKKRKEKQGKVDNNNKHFFTFTFIWKKFYFVRKYIWKHQLIQLCTYIIVSGGAGYLKHSYEIATAIQIFVGLVNTVLDSRLVISQ